MDKKPRYSRVSDIVDLAIFMSSKLQGVTLSDIADRYNVCRRTAERMRDSLTCIFPQVDEIEVGDGQKHWGFINYSIAQLVSFTPKEIANIEQYQRRTNNKEIKNELTKVLEKIKTLNKKNTQTLENNIELYMQTEGYAVRQSPQYSIDLKIIEVIREALQQHKVVCGTYHNKCRMLEPLGLIYGEKIYLVAREKQKGDDIYTYLLHKFEDLYVIDKPFDRGDFDLQEYNNQSFGVYHGDILDVKLRFSPNVAQEASCYNFHPSQKGYWDEDGCYVVSFKASGDKEIMWHVFKWGDDCEILSPQSLVDEYKSYLDKVLNRYV